MFLYVFCDHLIWGDKKVVSIAFYLFLYIDMRIDELRVLYDKIIAHLETAYMHLQVWRASSGLVEELHVHVTSWGMDQKMNQVANITTVDPQTLKIEPWDKAVLKDIEKSIYDAAIGLTPLNQGDYILIKVPPLTQERRKELTKVVAKDGEDAKIALRNKRHDARKALEVAYKNDEISENIKKGEENKIDELTKKFNDEVDRMVKAKSEEVMTI